MQKPPTRTFQTTTHSFAFLLTGAATALLGATLPILLKTGHFTDTTGGSLLLLAWGGSTCGALLFRGNLRRSSAAGLSITALSMLALAGFHRGVALPLFAFYGLGLGIAMTAITLLSSQGTSEAMRNRIMMRLNLLWSIGACIAPTLATHALSHTRMGGLFTAMGLVFCAAAIAVLFSGKETQTEAKAEDTSRLTIAPFALYAMAFLAVGVESALGGWLTTFANRTAHTELTTISAITAFWVGLLVSRALHSLPGLTWLQSQPVLIAHAAIATLASATLLAAPHSVSFVPSALLAGFGLGPLYPRVLAMVVGNYKPRAIFIVAGVGSAALPWLTGALSHAAGSLGQGMLVPCVGAAVLLSLMITMSAQAHRAAS
jgi:fucose permease